MPGVFEQLIKERYRAPSASQVSIYKCLVNHACGYLGLKRRQGPQTQNKWLVTGIHRSRVPIIKSFHLLDAGDFNYRGWFTRQQLAPLSQYKKTRASACASALHIFVTIIDLGKMRWGQCLHFIQKMSRPHSVQLLYAHIDNMILALADLSLDLLQIQPDPASEAMSPYLAPLAAADATGPPLPGQLKLEFSLTAPDWSFASPYPCFYSVRGGPSKTSSLNNLTSAQSFEYALLLLAGIPATVPQIRSTHKVSHTQTASREIQLQPTAAAVAAAAAAAKNKMSII